MRSGNRSLGSGSKSEAILEPSREHWWWRDFESALRGNWDLDFFLHWKIRKRQNPHGFEWTRVEKQTFELLFWLYEVDARVSGNYLFGGPAHTLPGPCVKAVAFLAHPSEGTVEVLKEKIERDPERTGRPMKLKSDRPIEPGFGEQEPFTPWLDLWDNKRGGRAKNQISFNLAASDKRIEAEFRIRSSEIGIRCSRRRIFALLKVLRQEYDIERPAKTAQGGDRRKPIRWEWIEYFDKRTDKNQLEKMTRTELNRIRDAERLHSRYFPSSEERERLKQSLI